MTALRDLAVCDCLPAVAHNILAVGWLGDSADFPTGPTPQGVFDRLRAFGKSPWQPFVACGSHRCEVCQFDGEQSGSANLYIPFESNIYVAPELITHYINAHFYQPPPVFCEAVMACPAMDSMDYKRLLIACNGRILWQSPSA